MCSSHHKSDCQGRYYVFYEEFEGFLEIIEFFALFLAVLHWSFKLILLKINKIKAGFVISKTIFILFEIIMEIMRYPPK